MRALTILGILSASHAGYSGYNYNRFPGQRFSEISSQSIASGSAFAHLNRPTGFGGSRFHNRGFSSGGFGGSGFSTIGLSDERFGGGGFSAVEGFGTSGSIESSNPGQHRNEPLVTKHFYFHSAPEEPEEPVHKHIRVGSPRKNYKVVFIKAPSLSRQPTRISVVPAQTEDKTVIYVLSKKTEATDIQAEIQPTSEHHSKPEVYFIKYKTQEEAVQAQQQIQAQYDALGGTSQVSDEGVAPITSVIGSNDGPSNFDSSYPSTISSHNGRGYLPSKV